MTFLWRRKRHKWASEVGHIWVPRKLSIACCFLKRTRSDQVKLTPQTPLSWSELRLSMFNPSNKMHISKWLANHFSVHWQLLFNLWYDYDFCRIYKSILKCFTNLKTEIHRNLPKPAEIFQLSLAKFSRYWVWSWKTDQCRELINPLVSIWALSRFPLTLAKH